MGKVYKVSGMTCGGCARSLTEAITRLDAAVRVEVDLASGAVTVEGDLDAAQVKSAVEAAGFDFLGSAAT